MAFFGKILEKLGFGGAAEKTTTVQTSGATPASASAAPAAKPVGVVDVVAQLEQRAAANPQKLKLAHLHRRSAQAARHGQQPGRTQRVGRWVGLPPGTDGGDSAKMNMWLHKTVLARIAENGGNVPKELLDWACSSGEAEARTFIISELEGEEWL
jgi:hypothetical protein